VPVDVDSGEPEMWPEDVVEYRLDKVEVAASKKGGAKGTGTLYITKRRVIWIGDQGCDLAYDFDVAYIVLHAITRVSLALDCFLSALAFTCSCFHSVCFLSLLLLSLCSCFLPALAFFPLLLSLCFALI
jgi:hypothetical protein